MVSSFSFLACGLAILPSLVSGSPVPVPRYFQRELVTRSNISVGAVESELGAQLSTGSLVFGPESDLYYNATSRWNTLNTPDVQVVVQPAEESDISKIVKYCNDNSFEFLVRNRGHGTTNSLSAFSGIEINVEQLQGLTIHKDSMTATIQGGAYGGPVVDALWAEGFVTTTGATPCVGLMGPALGGGHSRYEGLYGLVQDDILHYNVVLANGTELGVNETSHPDLLWALKGAGHNFAIVTSIEKQIYVGENWHTHTYIWTQDKLETVFETLNNFSKSDNGTLPARMGVNYGAIIMNTSISETEAVLSWGFQYAGPGDEAEELLAPFNAIEAVVSEQVDSEYPATGGATTAVCPASNRVISSIMAKDYNLTTERALYDLFVEKVAELPEIAPTAYLYHEGFATAGYQAIPGESTAYPHRDENLILVFFSEVPDDNAELRSAAEEWAEASRDLWDQGEEGPAKVYVNYAQGYEYETVESVYGYESWRLDRLRSLKAEYDPENRFRFFVPIIPEGSS